MNGLATRLPPLLSIWLAAAVLLGACGSDEQAAGPDGVAPSELARAFDGERAMEDVVTQVGFGERPAGSPENRRMTRWIAAELSAAGATGVEIQEPHRNVVGTVAGEGSGAILFGAHHDTKDDVGEGFEGANDGASGVAVVLEIARALPEEWSGPTVHLALFDAEETRGERDFLEDGMRGSRQYVQLAEAGGEQGSVPLADLDALVLFDMVGDCDLAIPYEPYSSRPLYDAIAAAGAELEEEGGRPSPFGDEQGAVMDDHIPFLDAGLPAVNLIDFEYGPGPPPGAWWHTLEDTIDKVCPESLEAVGQAALAALEELPEAASASPRPDPGLPLDPEPPPP